MKFWVFGTRRRDLSPELVLMARIIAIAWLLTGHALLVPTFSTAFVPALVGLAHSAVWSWIELIVGLMCTANLILGRSARLSAIVLALQIFVMTVLSHGYFSNNRLCTACVLLLVGLSPIQGAPRLLRLQVVFLYLAAGLDKLFDADWRSGAFMQSLSHGVARHGRLWSPGPTAHGPWAPARAFAAAIDAWPLLAKVASVGTITLEVAIGVAFVLGHPRIAISAGLLFHVFVLIWAGSPMGMFFYSATAAYLAFVTFPDRVSLTAPRRWHFLFRLDADERFVLEDGDLWTLRDGMRARHGLAAVCHALCCLPAYWVFVAIALSGPWFWPGSATVLFLPLLAMLPQIAPPREVTNQLDA